MNRDAYIGDVHGGQLPTQAEAAAYFAAMAAQPSNAWKTAVNLAIYEWKQQGNWANLKGMWLLCAESAQAAALSVIGDTPRNMTVTGAPTFTASKGYSGFDLTTKQLVFPITSTTLADDDFTTIFAGILKTYTSGTDRMAIENATDASISGVGNVRVTAGGAPQMASGNGAMSGSIDDINGQAILAGVRDGAYVLPGSIAGASPSALVRGSNYKTANVAAASHPLLRLSAYGFLGSASTPRMAQRAMITLAKLIDTLGALD